MIGVLTFDDAMDILEQEATDDILFKAGSAMCSTLTITSVPKN